MRHRVLQLAIIYASGINQLSPGAYFLRRDLFPSLVNARSSFFTCLYDVMTRSTVHQIG